MTARVINQMIGRALTERSFREKLLRSPQDAIRGFPLSALEQSQIASLKAMNLEEFSQLLSERLREVVEPDTDRSIQY